MIQQDDESYKIVMLITIVLSYRVIQNIISCLIFLEIVLLINLIRSKGHKKRKYFFGYKITF